MREYLECSWAIIFNFQKGALLGQKAALSLWYVDTRPNSQNCSRAVESLSYLACKIQKQLMFSYIFIHIIQLSGKKVNIHY